MTNELNFESLLTKLSENITSVELGCYKINELKMSDQRKILNMNFNAIEIPARISKIFNEFISSSVSISSDYIQDVLSYITVDVKPFILAQIRILTLGDTYVDRKDKKVYTIDPITDDSVMKLIEPVTINHNNMEITISVPTLKIDETINSSLLMELGKYKKDISEEDYGKIADLYQLYEICKYISTITMGDKQFDFTNCPINKKIKIVNNLSPRVVSAINQYIEKSKENGENKITATNHETNETIKLDVTTIFFENTARIID